MGATLYIDHRAAQIRRDRAALELRLPDRPPRRIPLRGLDRVVVHGSAEIDAAALNLMWETGVAFLCLTGRTGTAGARFHGAAHKDAGLRLAQYALWHDAETRLAWARDLFRFRLRVLRKTARSIAARRRGGRQALAPAIEAIGRAESSLASVSYLDALRGVEGAMAAAWFSVLAELFPPSLGFSTRQRRPPPDPVNAALSLGYTIATAEASRAAVRAGFDPAIGLSHGLAHGRESLALDLVEPARPLVDEFVHDLFHRRALEARSFTADGKGGVLLGKAGRRVFYEAWEIEAAPRIRTVIRLAAREGIRRLRSRKATGCERDAGAGDDIVA